MSRTNLNSSTTLVLPILLMHILAAQCPHSTTCRRHLPRLSRHRRRQRVRNQLSSALRADF